MRTSGKAEQRLHLHDLHAAGVVVHAREQASQDERIQSCSASRWTSRGLPDMLGCADGPRRNDLLSRQAEKTALAPAQVECHQS